MEADAFMLALQLNKYNKRNLLAVTKDKSLFSNINSIRAEMLLFNEITIYERQDIVKNFQVLTN